MRGLTPKNPPQSSKNHLYKLQQSAIIEKLPKQF